MALRFKLQLVVDTDGEQVSVEDLVVLDKHHERPEHLGLTLAEAKALLLAVQRQVLTRQVAAFPGFTYALPGLRPTARHQGPQDHRLPHRVRQAGAGEPAAASLSVSA